MLERVYVEIGNICNLKCSFCPSTERERRRMSAQEFRLVCEKLSGKCKFLYLHVMGEPLYHPQLDGLLSALEEYPMKACITTNGTLLGSRGDILLSHSSVVHKVSISLHAPEGNGAEFSEKYLKCACDFARAAASLGIFVVFRLWNLDSEAGEGANSENALIEGYLKEEFPEDWQRRPRGFRLKQNVFLEYDGLFTWPAKSEREARDGGYCHALSQQAAILADGTVVPCCLDSEGKIPLGNIFTEELDEILASNRAAGMKKGFERGALVEPLCRSCSFSERFSR